MPPKKPKTTEPPPPARVPLSNKKTRTSLPNLPPSSPPKSTKKRRTTVKDAAEEEEDDNDEVGVEKKKPSPKARAAPVKKKAKVDPVEDKADGGEEKKKVGKKIPVQTSAKGAAHIKGKSSVPSRAKPARRQSSKGEDKIGQIYAVGHELLSDTSVERRATTINTTIDKLEKQLHIPPDQLKRLQQERSELYRKINGLMNPVQEIIDCHTELRESLITTAALYEEIPLEARDILAEVEKAHQGAIESGLQYIENSQDFTAFIRGAKRFITWT